MKYTNTPSQRVAEKSGMKFLMEYEDMKNKFTRVYSITIKEYKNNDYEVTPAPHHQS